MMYWEERKTDPDMLRIEAALAELSKQQDMLWAELVSKFPLPEGQSWALSMAGKLMIVNTDG
jgi:hypothetical protein